jgi:GNAT superfamily N-acetyltransferase
MKALLNDGSGCDIVQDSGTIGINFAYTNREMQGLGIASQLLKEFMKWGTGNNMKRCSVDFESQNKEGSKFWLRYFKPICYSVIRKIDDRIYETR